MDQSETAVPGWMERLSWDWAEERCLAVEAVALAETVAENVCFQPSGSASFTYDKSTIYLIIYA